MQHFKKRIVALAMVLAMLLSLMPVAFAADVADFPDMPAEDDPSYAAVKAAVDNGLLTGENGKLNLEGTILRSTISKIVASAFGATDKADLSAYSDADGWYTEWLAKASQMGIMHGSNGKMRPNDPMTRQEAYVVLSRVLNLGKGTANDLKGVKGAGDLAAWAVPEVAPLVKAGYVTDLTAAAKPITRGEFVQVMHNIFSDYISEAGTVTKVGTGSVMVNVPGVTLKDCTVKGDLVIADGVGDGEVTLDNVKVEGRLVVRGGGANSVRVINNSNVASDVVVIKVNGNVRVYADSTSALKTVTVQGGKKDVIIEGTVATVAVASSATPVVLRSATVSRLEVSASGVKVELAGSTSVTTMKVDSAAKGVAVTAGAGTKITTINAGTDVTVSGSGKVEKTQGTGKVTDSQGKEVGTAQSTSASSSGPKNPISSSGSTGTSGSGSGSGSGDYYYPGISTGSVDNHTHLWSDGWSSDEGSHWHACVAVNGCTARADEEWHVYDDNGERQEDCPVCGWHFDDEHYEPSEPDHEHDFSGEIVRYTEYGHYVRCVVDGCGWIEYGVHTMDGTDEHGDRVCTTCGYVEDSYCLTAGHMVVWTTNGGSYSHLSSQMGTCIFCGVTMWRAHIWSIEAVNSKVTCIDCGATKYVSVPHEHTYDDWYPSPVEGYHRHICRDADGLTCDYEGVEEDAPCVDANNDGYCDVCEYPVSTGSAVTGPTAPGGSGSET